MLSGYSNKSLSENGRRHFGSYNDDVRRLLNVEMHQDQRFDVVAGEHRDWWQKTKARAPSGMYLQIWGWRGSPLKCRSTVFASLHACMEVDFLSRYRILLVQ